MTVANPRARHSEEPACAGRRSDEGSLFSAHHEALG